MWKDLTASDNGGGVRINCSPESHSTFELGNTLVVCDAYDEFNNSATCSFSVSVIDEEPPYFDVCPTNISETVHSNSSSSNVQWRPPIANDSASLCVTVKLTIESLLHEVNYCANKTENPPIPPYVFSIGTHVVLYEARDDANNSVDCSFIVEVIDDTDPLIIDCPSNLNYTTDDGKTYATISWNPVSATDNSGTARVEPDLTGGEYDIGEHQVVFIAVDSSNNKVWCVFNITVTDNEAPSVVGCPNNITSAAEDGGIHKQVYWAEPVFTDNDSPLNKSQNFNSGDMFTIGIHQVMYTALDPSGLWAICVFFIHIQDLEPPTILNCPSDITAQANGTTNITWSPIQASDNTGSLNVTCDHESGETFPAESTTPVMCSTIDPSGNVDSCTFFVILTDAVVPRFTYCPDNIQVPNDPGTNFAVVDWSMPIAVDNNGIPVISSNKEPNSTFYINMPETVIYTARDTSLSIGQCIFTVTVLDNELPVFISCPNDTTVVPYGYNSSAFVEWDHPEAEDNDAVSSLLGPPSEDIFEIGEHPQNYIASDNFGNSAECSFTIFVKDVLPPQFDYCPDDILNFTSPQLPYAVVTWPDPIASDNYGIPSIISSPASGEAFMIGVDLVLLTASDTQGNKANCSFNVTIVDVEPPRLTNNCPMSQTGVGSFVTFIWTPPIFADNDVVMTTLITHNPGVSLTVLDGTTLVNYTAIDPSGNYVSCFFNLTVEDNDAPVFTNCAGLSVNGTTDVRSNVSTVSLPSLSATDNSGNQPTITDDYVGNIFPFGETDVVYTARDVAGNEATCIVTVTITDNEPPRFMECPGSLSVSATNATTTSTYVWDEPIVTDNIEIMSVTSNIDSGSIFPLGTTEVIYTATDTSGNIQICKFDVTVQDDTSPWFTSCPPSLVQCAIPGNTTSLVTWIIPSANDNDGQPNVTSTHDQNTVFTIGEVEVTYTATDATGNNGFCMFTITVKDCELPKIMNCPDSISVTPDPLRNNSAYVTWDEPTATDNSGIATINSPQVPGEYSGETEIIYTATDPSGNKAFCIFNVVVGDSEAPTFENCPSQNLTVMTDEGESYGNVSWSEPIALDNAGKSGITIGYPDIQQYSHQSIGTYPIVYTATDFAGNVGKCSFAITVADAEAPMFEGCPSNLQFETLTGSSRTIVSWIEPTVSDNSDSDTNITSTRYPNTSADLGTFQVTYTAVDPSNNKATCIFTISVVDGQAPNFTYCPSNNVYTTSPGLSTGTAYWIEPSATDNIGTPILTNTRQSNTTFVLGETVVTYTATDSVGNTARCSFTIDIQDTEPPVLKDCPGDIVLSNDTNIAFWTPPTATDNTGLLSITASHSSGISYPVGSTTVIYTATDKFDNEAKCNFTIIATVLISPVVKNCPEYIEAETDGDATTAVVVWEEPTAEDDSPLVCINSTHKPGDVFPIGSTTVMYKFEDTDGRLAFCTFNVVVTASPDTTRPVLICPDDIEVSLGPLSETVQVTWDPATVSDNRGGNIEPSSTVFPNSFFSFGVTTVEYIAFDEANNKGSCTFTVNVTTVPDTEVPEFDLCPDDVTRIIGNTTENPVVTWNVPTATDNSGNVEVISAMYKPGDAFGPGHTVVLYTAVDPSSNSAVCSFTITVIVDDEPPDFEDACPGDITVTNTNPQDSAIVTWNEPTVTDLTTVTTIMSNGPNTSFPLGTTTVTYTFSDQFANVVSCSFKVLVQNEDLCQEMPCLNGAACSSDGITYSCTCTSGWTGNNCSIDIDECADKPCEEQFVCQNVDGSYICDCPPGKAPNNAGDECVDGSSIRADVVVAANYTEDLADSTSAAYQNFVKSIIDDLIKAFIDIQEYLGVKITRLQPGSVIVEFIVIFEQMSNVSTTDVQQALDGFIEENNGVLGEFPVSENGTQVIEELCDNGYCKNDGVCSVNQDYRSSCTCQEGYTGVTCEELIDSEPPEFSECPEIIMYKVLSEISSVLVRWNVEASDNSGRAPTLSSSPYVSGESRLEPGDYMNEITAVDEYGNVANCTFPINVDVASDTFVINAEMTLGAVGTNFIQDLDDLFRLTPIGDYFAGVVSLGASSTKMTLMFYFTSQSVTELDVLSSYMAAAPSNVFGSNVVTLFIVGDGPCEENVCGANGECNAVGQSEYTCTCNTGWEGTNCSTDINECSNSEICPIDGEVCQNRVGSFECLCPPGQWRINRECTDAKEFRSFLVLEQTFDDALNMESSVEYLMLQDDLLPLKPNKF
ncbi:hyalin-like [Anneissia japonica]|uniref:hyalin-like n=1 Tax=Anneissia japonica TaxID=1529436 RepID=UPI0014255497|nr:hyalin-like [Anneissia japonica]